MANGNNSSRRVVITGIGAITPLGTGVEKLWEGLMAGRSGIRKIEHFDASELACQIAGEIPDFIPADHIPARESRRMSRSSQIALAAIQMAVENAGLEEPLVNSERIGVTLGTAVGGLERSIEGARAYREEGPNKVNPFTIPASIANMSAFHISERYKAYGPSMCLVTACATGTQIVGEAAQTIRDGRADIVLTAGTEAMIEGFAVAGFGAMRGAPHQLQR